MTVALMPHRGTLRVLRGTVLAAVNAVLAVAAHVAGGGGAPDGALTVLITVGVAAAGTALADRRRGPVAMLAAVAVTQVLLHLLLEALGGHTSAAVPTSAGAAMTVAHGAAVLVTAALLTGAESALFAAANTLTRIVGVFPLLMTAPLRADRRPTTPPAAAPLPDALRRLLCRATPLRGPPLPR
ncbi:MAG: hypothetical protein ACRDTE_12070 [Pseudonocardiaceae bacterium]